MRSPPYSMAGPVTRLLAAATAILLLAGPPVAQAQNAFQQGLDAYLSGDYDKAMELWRPAAEAGDEVAAFNVGVLHARGLGVDPDPAAAVRWYRQSAIKGYANAQFNLGSAYFNGVGTARNTGQAVSWWQQAAAQDHPEALYNLGLLYRDGKVVERDRERARSLLEAAALAGDDRAGEALSKLAGASSSANEPPASNGDSGTSTTATQPGNWPASENPAHWTVQVFAAASAEDARRFVTRRSLSDRVRIYQARTDNKTWYKGVAGSYASRDEARAAQRELETMLPGASPWIRRLADIQAEAVAEVRVGGGASVSAEVMETPGDAGETPEPAPTETDPGDGSASGVLTGVPAEGGGDPDGAAATSGEDERQAGNGGDGERRESGGNDQAGKPDSGQRLRAGQRAFNAQDYESAFEAWRPLAENGVADAQYGIAFMYESGWGVQEDFSRAFRWYQLAAQQGHVKSQFNLGMLYRNGKGVARNDALALYWIQTAADSGDERALNYLDNLN